MHTHHDLTPLQVDVDPTGCLRLRGPLDMEGRSILQDRIDAIPDGAPIEIDLGEVSFVDSSGLGTLFAAAQRQLRHESHLVVRNPTARTMRLLALTGMDGMFRIVHSG